VKKKYKMKLMKRKFMKFMNNMIDEKD